ncbi:sulfur reduction protein DsrJ [Leucothrix sargassi]|nr:sulfur reduction protein DsrJ [Leucothrix sargassi]
MSKLLGLVSILFALLAAACSQESAPVGTLMAAQKQFASVEERDLHVIEMRTNHMHLLKHKRDQTMYQGIRTPKHSLHACIDCHVPVPTKALVVKHTNPQHFCSTCHIALAVKIDCFECHADRPEALTEVKP